MDSAKKKRNITQENIYNIGKNKIKIRKKMSKMCNTVGL